MDFGFPAAVDNGQLDPSTQAILANLSAPQPAQPAQDAAPPQAQPAPQGQSDNWNPNPVLAALRWLSTGGPPQDAMQAERLHHYQAQYQAQAMSQLPQLMATLPPQARAAIAMGGPGVWNELSKNMAPQTRSAGQTTDYWGGAGTPGGRTAGTDTYATDDKSGLPTQYGPGIGGFRTLGPSLGGDYTAANGVISSGRTGQVAGAYSTPQTIPAGSNGVPFTPTVSGPGAPPAADAGPMAPPQTSAANAPRGIRNNNFGNIKALPGGQAWQGQVGVDDQGHAIFDTPENGVLAAKKNLTSYATRDGINTVSGLVGRWAGGATPQSQQNYAAYLSGSLHVAPDQKIDLTDPKVQQPLLRGIFAFENGPEAMSAWRGPAKGQGVQAQSSGQGQPPAQPGGGYGAAYAQGKSYEVLPPTDPLYQRYAPGTVLKKAPNGEVSADTSNAFGPDQLISLRGKLNDEEPVKNWRIANTAYGAMTNAAAQHNGGIRAYALRDTFARLINPGAVARVGTIEAIKQSQGVPANIQAYLMNLKGDGDVPPQIAQQILDISRGFLSSHYAEARAMNDNYAQFAGRHKVNPADITVQMGAEPQRMILGPVPPPQQRVPAIYSTPKGPLQWTGSGWRKTN